MRRRLKRVLERLVGRREIREYHEYLVHKHSGHKVRLPTDRGGKIGAAWSRGDFYESRLLEDVRDLDLGGTYIDAGMNCGNHALYFAKVCPSERVLGFEPFLHLTLRSSELFIANRVRDKVSTFQLALSDGPDFIDLTIAERTTSTFCLRLDDLAPHDVTVIKIDVEGAEMHVLRGAKETIARWKPHLFIEIFDETFEETKAEIESMGYEMVRRYKSPTYHFRPVAA